VDQLTSLSQENVFHLSVRNTQLNPFVLKLFTEPFYQKTLIDKNYHLQPNFEGNMPIHIATSEVLNY
jgi:hypothetical protein